MNGVVEIVIDSPCYGCHRLTRYTAYHRADEALLARLRQPISHRDVHDLAAILESGYEQVPIGRCACGAPGQETTSLEFWDRATREDLNYVADDLSFEMVRLSLNDQALWESDLEVWRRGLNDQHAANLDAIRARLHAAFRALDNDPPGAEYVRAKARLYCRVGAIRYRALDALHQPDAALPMENSTAIDWGMAQLADGLGFSAATPLTVPAEYSHSLVAALHFDVFAQMARRSTDGGFILDALLCRHVIDGRELTIFNRVPSRQRDTQA